MAIIIDRSLSADPDVARLPRAEIDLEQTLHAIPVAQRVTITYVLDGGPAIRFETPDGPSDRVEFEDDIPVTPKDRSDPVVLIAAGDSGMAQIKITQLIDGQEEDSVLLAVDDAR